MGTEVRPQPSGHGLPPSEARRAFMRRLLRDVRALEKMLEGGQIETGIRRIGAEQEIFLVDRAYNATPKATEVLAQMNEPLWGHELGLYNLECSVDPVVFGGSCLRQMEDQLAGLLKMVHGATAAHGVRAVMTGILPTIEKSDLGLHNQTPNPRYRLLNDTLGELRGDAYEINIKGADEMMLKHDSVMLESANTSFQIHFQVGPEEFAKLYNIAQGVCAPVLAVAVNSPLLFGRRLWQETRIALFQQSVDTRSPARHLRDQQPRVSFGSRWVNESVMEIFHEDIARFRVLFGVELDDEDALDALAGSRTPQLGALRLHNSTVYRWNRPCYGVDEHGVAHLRIENRVLPAGPTLIDEMANAAFWFGLMSGVVHEVKDITELLEFGQAQANFVTAARQGLAAPIHWLDGKTYPAHELIERRLLPLAKEGLQEGGIDPDDVERYLSVISGRIETRTTGADWMLRSYSALSRHHSRRESLSALTAATIRFQQEGAPVHTWALATGEDRAAWRTNHDRVGQIMSQDMITLKPDEPVEFATSLMTWHHIHWIPVEDNEEHFVGLITHDLLLGLYSDPSAQISPHTITVEQIMLREVASVSPQTSTLDALRLMDEARVSCLPVVEEGRLVGLVTDQEVMAMAKSMLEERLQKGAEES